MAQSEDLSFCTETGEGHWKVLITEEKQGLSWVALAALENLRKESRGRSRRLLQKSATYNGDLNQRSDKGNDKWSNCRYTLDVG